MPAQLQALNEGASIMLDKPILLLGRDLECDIRLDSRKISRRHCCIAQVGEQLVIRDLGSTNGIRINGVRVVEGRLSAGDELTIGNYRYRVKWEAVGGKPAAPAAPRKDKRKAPVMLDRPAAEDDLLESSDEPVALSEPNGVVAAPVAKAPSSKRKVKVELDDAPPARANYPGIVPENLELAPSSDVVEKPPPQPPALGSNHPFPPPVPPEGSDSLHMPPA